MSFILGAIKIIIVLGTLIIIHEMGHFLVAKACNVKVHKFSIGFGKKIFCKQRGETEYTLRLFPFGGFVQLEGEDERSDDPRAFNNKPIWQRMLIIVAGAFVNIVFALILYYGVCVADNQYMVAQIDSISEESALYSAGLRDDDKIISINGKKTITANDVEDIIQNSVKDDMTFVIKRGEEQLEINVDIPYTSIGMIGVVFNNGEELIVQSIEKGSPAEKVGISSGDKILAVNDISMKTSNDIIMQIRNNADNEIKLLVEKIDGTKMTYNVLPNSVKLRVSGIKFCKKENLNFFENSYYAVDETGYYFNANIDAILKMITGNLENVQLMGPVGIAKEISGTEAISQFFLLMAAISLSLGIFNLFPIPALDGGKFLILFIELIRRKPMQEKTEIAIQLAGLTLILLMAIIVTIGDVIKLF